VAERDIQHAILVAIGALPGVFVERMNTGGARMLDGSFVRFGTPGRADLWVCVLGRLVLLEVKTERGRLSKDQQDWSAAVVRATEGRVVYEVVRSVDDAVAVVQRVLAEERAR